MRRPHPEFVRLTRREMDAIRLAQIGATSIQRRVWTIVSQLRYRWRA